MEDNITPVEFVEKKITILIPEDIGSQLMYKSNIKKAKDMEFRQKCLFLRWLKKHYSTHTTPDGFFCYVNSMGQETEIEHIVNHYYNDIYGN